MKKLIGPLVLVVVAAALSSMITRWTVSSAIEQKESFRADRLAMQMEFLYNNSILRPITDIQGRPDLQKYLQEVNTLANWYLKNPVKKFLNAHPEAADLERVIKEKRRLAEEEGPRQKVAKSNLPLWEEAYQLVHQVYDSLKQGTYQAVASGFQGSVRLDVVGIENKEGKLRWTIMVWGGIGPIVYDGWHLKWFKSPSEQDRQAYEKELALAKRRQREPEMKDPATLHFAESASATKHPVLNFELRGADYIDGFPPGAQLNYYHTPACPPDAETMEMEFKLKSRAVSGQNQVMSFVFKLPVKPEWKGSWAGVQKVEAASDY